MLSRPDRFPALHLNVPNQPRKPTLMSNEKRYIVSCSYESKRQAHPGQAAVLDRLLPVLEQSAGIPVIGVSPCHRNFPSFPTRWITTVAPPYRGGSIPVDVLQDRDDHRWFYLLARHEDVCDRPGEPPFFNGRADDLYRVSDQGESQNARLLLRDVLLFASAVRLAVRLLIADIPLHLVAARMARGGMHLGPLAKQPRSCSRTPEQFL
jgi:hypothetical protein